MNRLFVISFVLFAGSFLTVILSETINADESDKRETEIICSTRYIDWEVVQPENYDSIYSRVSEPFFLSQFSMKRGYKLETFFPLLFPKSPEVLEEAGVEVREKLESVKWDVNQTLHEVFMEYTLLPKVTESLKKNVRLEYVIQPENHIPVSFLIEEALRVRRVRTEKPTVQAEHLAISLARQCGCIEVEIPKNGEVLLVPDSTTFAELTNSGEFTDVLCEFQIPYATVTQGNDFHPARLGYGAAEWESLRLLVPRNHYSPATQRFLARFEEFGGKIKE